jgi:Flp pilus assembly protein TadG
MHHRHYPEFIKMSPGMFALLFGILLTLLLLLVLTEKAM